MQNCFHCYILENSYVSTNPNRTFQAGLLQINALSVRTLILKDMRSTEIKTVQEQVERSIRELKHFDMNKSEVYNKILEKFIAQSKYLHHIIQMRNIINTVDELQSEEKKQCLQDYLTILFDIEHNTIEDLHQCVLDVLHHLENDPFIDLHIQGHEILCNLNNMDPVFEKCSVNNDLLAQHECISEELRLFWEFTNTVNDAKKEAKKRTEEIYQHSLNRMTDVTDRAYKIAEEIRSKCLSSVIYD
ncbi:PREDICTED: uncharacterized protein LOC106744852 [Dinoponera quadriceps]|uniref:Uncharacterized protein LOC106744852 n=1 Tax=Dinoponera quadriceps TaxID=609295 RepID=A0A6P3XC12_DINQU|nr:PREDICTED: uncharacterized protein LOC106744852 [Dinoponera quadriceps]